MESNGRHIIGWTRFVEISKPIFALLTTIVVAGWILLQYINSRDADLLTYISQVDKEYKEANFNLHRELSNNRERADDRREADMTLIRQHVITLQQETTKELAVQDERLKILGGFSDQIERLDARQRNIEIDMGVIKKQLETRGD